MTEEPDQAKNSGGGFYGDDFYRSQLHDSERSAKQYLSYLSEVFCPQTVLDVGCGRGAWLKVWLELGATETHGYDGPWNRAEHMIDSRIKFRSIDLDGSFSIPQKVDLAMSLEVAEHLKPEVSEAFVHSLTGCSDAVLFGAAYTGQGGTNHINERPHSYWGHRFGDLNFAAYDIFRPRFWGDESVCYWYRQNTFLYLRRNSNVFDLFRAAGFKPLERLAFLDCVHPELYGRAEPIPVPTLGFLSRSFGPALSRSLKHRFSRSHGNP